MTKEEPKKTPKPKGHGGARGGAGAREGSGARAAHKKVFDVVPPGKSVAPPNSRSVIVGHKPPVKDDQFVPGGGSGGGSKAVEGSKDAAADGGTSIGVAETTAHSRMAGDPFEKRPLMGGHKKLDLKLDSDNTDGDGRDSGSNNGSDGGHTTTAPELSSSVLKSAGVDKGSAKESSEASVGSAAAKEPSVARHESPAPGPSPVTSPEAPGAPVLGGLSGSASEHLADLAVEQIVETETFDEDNDVGKAGGTESAGGANTAGQSGELRVLDQPISGSGEALSGAGATPGVPPSAASATSGVTGATGGAAPGRPSTVDDLLADTSPPSITPQPQQAIVSHHHRRGGALRVILTILLVLILGVAALNFLLDAEIIKTNLDLPYTDLIK